MEKSELQAQLLAALDEKGEIASSDEFARQMGRGVTVQDVHGVVIGLESHAVVAYEAFVDERQVLTVDGEAALVDGAPEVRLVRRLHQTAASCGLPRAEVDDGCFRECMKLKWIVFDKAAGCVCLAPAAPAADAPDAVAAVLRRVRDGEMLDKKEAAPLITRKLVAVERRKLFRVRRGEKFSRDGPRKLQLDITADMFADPANPLFDDPAAFKPLNLDALGRPVSGGHLHPLMKVRAAFRQILLELGFSEMSTSRYVESAFWNFDSLFQPQQHPARDAHDTFFVREPATMLDWPREYGERVRAMHQSGFSLSPANSSIGWRYDWSLDEAKKNILRTHTTAVSARMLFELAQQKPFRPVRLFSIDRVFRNETLDATHLAEFHQIEGVVADYNLTLGDLIGTITQFFHKWGLTDLRFKPAFNPYTEPSMEIFAFHPGLKKWVEIGNSGMFRPEMLVALGLPPDVRVIAWGLGLERPTMIRYGLTNIRDLMGSRVSLNFVENASLFDMQLDDATAVHK
jgi:phenylalanyl-tRNA synthetase alpha chain